MTRDEHIRAEGAINALDVAGLRIQELEAECNRLGQGQIMLANEVAELEAENQRLKAPVSDAEKLSFFNNDNMAIWQKVCDVEALLASRATAKEQDNGPLSKWWRGVGNHDK
jgi:FtsZ-binding cell division protein ZapB